MCSLLGKSEDTVRRITLPSGRQLAQVEGEREVHRHDHLQVSPVIRNRVQRIVGYFKKNVFFVPQVKHKGLLVC